MNRFHFIGIGGIGMSGLARLYLREGAVVSGSDISETENTKKLESEGVAIAYEQIANNIVDGIDFVVYTEAVADDNPELMAARKASIRTINYFEALGEVANEYYLIAVAGTHGKTTTTAMLIDILEEASFDPTAIVGALRTKTGSNFRAGKSRYFVAEACEYKRDFLTLEPDMLVITNIEHEHVDYYKDLSSVQDAFRELAEKVPENGTVVANLGDKNISPVTDGLKCNVIDYKNSFDPMLSLPQPGIYNQMNAAAAKAAAASIGVEEKFITTALENFAGTKRRFEYKGEINDAPVYDDYAHHPTEILATISGVREKHPILRLTVVFQPHTFSRTKEFFGEFEEALAKADRVILAPIYAAREENESGVSSEQLAEKIKETNPNTEYFETFDEIVTNVKETVGKNDVVIVMGAGDITKVADMLV